MDAAAELGKNPVSKHQIQPEYGDEQANTGRDCQNRLARPNSPTTVGVEKRCHINWSMVTCQGSALVRNYLEVYWTCAGGLSAVNAIG